MSEHRPEQIRPDGYTIKPSDRWRGVAVPRLPRTAAAGKIDTSHIEREATQKRTHRRDG